MTRKLQKGFTLIEILIVMACSAIIGTILVTILVQGSSIFSDQTTKVNQNLSLNSASNQIDQTVQYASQISANYIDGSTTYTTSDKVLIGKLPAIDSSGNVIESKFDTFILMQDPVNSAYLKKLIIPDLLSSRKSEDMTLLNQMTFLQFVYLNDSAVVTTPQTASKIDFVIKVAEKSGNGIKESSISGRINLKNI
jgi:prepilin-type N-terminal cleavage/methylation domain-containing protein